MDYKFNITPSERRHASHMLRIIPWTKFDYSAWPRGGGWLGPALFIGLAGMLFCLLHYGGPSSRPALLNLDWAGHDHRIVATPCTDHTYLAVGVICMGVGCALFGVGWALLRGSISAQEAARDVKYPRRFHLDNEGFHIHCCGKHETWTWGAFSAAVETRSLFILRFQTVAAQGHCIPKRLIPNLAELEIARSFIRANL